MNDIQLYSYYLSIPLSTPGKKSWIYPNYVKITGRSISEPHPHRYLSFEEFIEIMDNFRKELYERAN